jgi:hypothetical protein
MKWICDECYKSLNEDIECYTIANQLLYPCASCGAIDSKAHCVCSPEPYLATLERRRFLKENRLPETLPSKAGQGLEYASEIYKGNGRTNCKWCGDTGMMRTFGGWQFYNDAPCICKIGQAVLREEMHKGVTV